MWDLKSRHEIGSSPEAVASLMIPGWQRPCVAFSPDGETVACPVQGARQIVLYSLPDFKRKRNVLGEQGVLFNAIAFAPDG